VTRTHHVYLIPGFFGFASLSDLSYFGHVRECLLPALRDLGLDAEIETVATFPTASLPRRAAHLLETVAHTADEGAPIHLVGHSSGGVDARLMTAPAVALPTAIPAEPWAARVRTVVTVAAPHQGTPVAAFFASLLGQRLLRALSLTTIVALRFGGVPLAILLKLGALFARLDDHVPVNSALLDQLFAELLQNFSRGGREAIERLFRDVSVDQSLLPQLTPEGMDVFNAATHDRAGVRYGCVVTRARPPGMGSVLAAGLDPTAHATHALYVALHRLASGMPPERLSPPGPAAAKALISAYGVLPDARDNDGIVPTLSQLWGDVIHVVRADHLDVVGHFRDPTHVPPHVDWITTGSGFDRAAFESVWMAVARYIAATA
jgi:triacylglycerol lipase